MDANRFEHGGNIYSAQRKTGQKPVLDFSANINPLGLSAKVRSAISENIDKVVHYPDAQAHDLKAQICRYYKVPADMLVLGNGATELLYLLCHVLRPDKVFLPVPCFSEYERAARSAGAQIEYFYLAAQKEFTLFYAELAQAIPNGALIFFGHPNNPTGKLLDQEGFAQFVLTAKQKNCQIILDESFIDFLPAAEQHTLRNYCLEHNNLFLIHSMTKFFAIPGLRLGFGLFPPDLAERLRQATDCWNVNNLAQAAGCAALQDAQYIDKSKAYLQQASQKFVAALENFAAIKIFASTVNFLLLDIRQTQMTADEFCARLSEQGVLVRNCANYPGLDEYYVRVAVRTTEENNSFVKLLREVIGG